MKLLCYLHPLRPDPNSLKFPAKDDCPGPVKLMIQYMYEGDYTPKLSQGPDVNINQPRPVYDWTGSWYTYDFPHACDNSGSSCSRFLICPHHNCEQYRCGFSCTAYTCDTCQNSPVELSDGV